MSPANMNCYTHSGAPSRGRNEVLNSVKKMTSVSMSMTEIHSQLLLIYFLHHGLLLRISVSKIIVYFVIHYLKSHLRLLTRALKDTNHFNPVE